ncbi:hypothetical protein L210DRAFT_3630813 [Boletus edulis BED1]|uniref:Protein-S-isoprenylcysteine O-methyltransferase n=1 Tax=Boletus edulis BED1 TaxID=1328754 RepID=A0AAD4BTU9_BOLED|nr:hypothetical protein L210DRAFT_3630813 [Boletus edulis BED1]
MAVAKLLLLILGGVAQLYGQTPPNVRPPTEHLREQRGIERGLPFIKWLGKVLLCIWVLLEATVLVAFADFTPPALAHHLSHVLLPSKLLPKPPRSPPPPPPSPSASSSASSALVTHGVYGIIRHPSYTGAFGLGMGWLLCVFDRRGVIVSLVASGGDLGQWSSGGDGRMDRMNNEDAMLEKNFGEEWRAWAKRVPYRLVPVHEIRNIHNRCRAIASSHQVEMRLLRLPRLNGEHTAQSQIQPESRIQAALQDLGNGVYTSDLVAARAHDIGYSDSLRFLTDDSS